ncbi:hypothetical protein BGZ94_004057 [Podila epigama]|nr:hypothetical protein BGZ94_004057 [Podila epigama]
MTKRTTKTTRYTAAVPAPQHNSSDSDNSDIEDRSHSRTSTSSVEEEVKVSANVNGNGTRTTTTTTTTRTYSSGSVPSEKTTTTTTTLSSSSSSSSLSSEANTGFLARVTSLPLIQDSVSTLTSYAEANKYSKYALDTAGSAVTTASKYTEAYQSRLQPLLQTPIAKVDQLANKSLDLIETTFPIVTKPTAEIVAEVKKPIVNAHESSLNAYTQLQTTIDARVTVPVKSVTANLASTATSTANTIATTAATTRESITTRAATTRENITTAATSTASSIASQVNTRAAPLVDGLETIVNRYLPPSSDSEPEETTATQPNQAARIVDLSRSVSRRVSRRVSVSVSPVAQSAQDLRRAAESNAVVVRSKESIQSLNVRLTALLETLRVHAKELQENVQKMPAEASTRVNDLSSTVLAEIDSLSVYLKENRTKLPEYVQARIEPLAGFINDRYVLVKTEISKNDVPAIQKARNILHLTTEETLPILHSAAQDVRESLLQYQTLVQEKVHTVNSSVSDVAARAVQSARVTLVGAK